MDPGSAAHHAASAARCAASGERAPFSPLDRKRRDASLSAMDAEASPQRSISGHFRGVLDAVRGVWARTARLALDIALPTLCVSCREPVHGEGVCAECWAKLSFIAPPFCPRLGIPFVYDPGPELLSMEAIANPPAYQRARAAVRYDDVARTLVHALKYQDRTDLAPAMGRWMARAGQELLAEADVLVPVPLHWRRGWSRRYLSLNLLVNLNYSTQRYTLPISGQVPRQIFQTILLSAAILARVRAVFAARPPSARGSALCIRANTPGYRPSR
jgi:predicted amidophosphoribosyltransferase